MLINYVLWLMCGPASHALWYHTIKLLNLELEVQLASPEHGV
jgi:hypothetical protein